MGTQGVLTTVTQFESLNSNPDESRLIYIHVYSYVFEEHVCSHTYGWFCLVRDHFLRGPVIKVDHSVFVFVPGPYPWKVLNLKGPC